MLFYRWVNLNLSPGIHFRDCCSDGVSIGDLYVLNGRLFDQAFLSEIEIILTPVFQRQVVVYYFKIEQVVEQTNLLFLYFFILPKYCFHPYFRLLEFRFFCQIPKQLAFPIFFLFDWKPKVSFSENLALLLVIFVLPPGSLDFYHLLLHGNKSYSAPPHPIVSLDFHYRIAEPSIDESWMHSLEIFLYRALIPGNKSFLCSFLSCFYGFFISPGIGQIMQVMLKSISIMFLDLFPDDVIDLPFKFMSKLHKLLILICLFMRFKSRSDDISCILNMPMPFKILFSHYCLFDIFLQRHDRISLLSPEIFFTPSNPLPFYHLHCIFLTNQMQIS